MGKGFVLVFGFVFVSSATAFAQAQSPGAVYPANDPMTNISFEVTNMSRSVASLTKSMKDFVDKFEKVGGITFNAKQQKLILGMELLQRAEARLAVLQKAQIDLTEKLNECKAKLAQNEIDARPRNIDRSFALEGTTELQELRENKAARLQSERINLTRLIQQIESNLADTTDGVRDAQSLVNRLRRLYLPQIEREIYEQ